MGAAPSRVAAAFTRKFAQRVALTACSDWRGCRGARPEVPCAALAIADALYSRLSPESPPADAFRFVLILATRSEGFDIAAVCSGAAQPLSWSQAPVPTGCFTAGGDDSDTP